jgi:hypothetical protein
MTVGSISPHPFLTAFFQIRITVDEKSESIFSAIKITWQQRKDFSTEWEIRLFIHTVAIHRLFRAISIQISSCV